MLRFLQSGQWHRTAHCQSCRRHPLGPPRRTGHLLYRRELRWIGCARPNAATWNHAPARQGKLSDAPVVFGASELTIRRRKPRNPSLRQTIHLGSDRLLLAGDLETTGYKTVNSDLYLIKVALRRFSKPPPVRIESQCERLFVLTFAVTRHRKESTFQPEQHGTRSAFNEGWCLSRSGNRSEHFRCYFAMGKIRGTLCMRSHISVHRATTKYFSKSFVFKTEIEKEGLPRDITPALGAGGPRFKSGRPDQNHLPHFLQLIESAVHPQPHLWNSGRQEV